MRARSSAVGVERGGRGALVVAALGLLAAACGKGEAPAPAPDRPAAAVAPDKAAAPPVDLPKPPVQVEAAPAPAPTESAVAAPAAPQAAPEKVAATPADAASKSKAPAAVAAAPAAEATAGKGADAVPKAPGGILGPGEADRLIKTGARPIVKLLDAGAAPQADLAYAFVKSQQRMGVRLDMSMGMSVGGTALPAAPVPRVVMLLDVGAGDRGQGGDYQVDGTVRSIDVEAKGAAQEKLADALRPQLASVKGLGMTHFVSPKGHMHGLTMKLPPDLPPESQQMLSGMSQSFESMVAPLPDLPVGPGARWQVVTRVNSAGADIVQFATYTLKARTGNLITLDVKLDQLASSASIAAPGMPPGVTAKLRAFSSGGTGSSRLDLTSVAPASGKMTMKSSMDIDLAGGPAGAGAQSRIDMTMTAEMFRPAK